MFKPNKKYTPFKTGVNKVQKQLKKAKESEAVANAKAKAYKAGAAAKQVRDVNRLTSSNPITRKLAQLKQSSIKKQEVKMRKLESDAKVAELDPKLQAEKARSDNRIRIEKARARSKTASSTAVAAGMASLGRGLSDENNQDDAARRAAQQKIIETIFQPEVNDSDNTGLSKGVE